MTSVVLPLRDYPHIKPQKNSVLSYRHPLYAQEFAWVGKIAAAVLECHPGADKWAITTMDIVRDALLHWGGLGNSPSEAKTVAAACEDSFSRLLRRRARVPQS